MEGMTYNRENPVNRENPDSDFPGTKKRKFFSKQPKFELHAFSSLEFSDRSNLIFIRRLTD